MELSIYGRATRQADPDDLITRASHIRYDPSTKCPRWLQFLGEIFPDDPGLTEFIQRATGYSLTGDTREQCMFILHGNGANGKSTFLETVRRLLGPHATTTPFATFHDSAQCRRASQRPSSFGRGEVGDCVRGWTRAGFDEAVIKQVTGQDTIACRFLYGEFFEYKPQFKIWLATNYKPAIRGNDDAIWRRIRLIPFNQQFKGDKRDSALPEKLKAELPGILAWAVQGCLEWKRNGLGSPQTVLAATLNTERNPTWLEGSYQKDAFPGKEYSVSGNALYSAYVQFCQQQGEKFLANNLFAAQIAKRGIEKKRTRGGFVYQGLGLQSRSG